MWDNSLFDEAFDRAGLRVQVAPLQAGRQSFQARFERPQQIMLEDQVHTTNYSIEYTSSAAPWLKLGDVLSIEGDTYRVSQPPIAQGDGYWTTAELEKV